MVEALARAVRNVFGDEDVRAIWFKGSAQKQWLSPIDYVPSLSDVDVHIWLSDRSAPSFHDLETALCVQAATEQLFASSMPNAIHVPRPQLNLINELKQNHDYIPSPGAIIETVYGESPEPGDYSDSDRVRGLDRASLITNAAEVENVPHRVIDRPGAFLWDLLRALSWRISPIGSRTLSVSGEDPETAWSMNRTTISQALRSRGLEEIASNWEQFYLANWRYYLSNNLDGAAGRDAIRAGSKALHLAGEFAQTMTPSTVMK